MSYKGAIKKTSRSNNESKSYTSLKQKNHVSSEINADGDGKADRQGQKVIDLKASGDRKSTGKNITNLLNSKEKKDISIKNTKKASFERSQLKEKNGTSYNKKGNNSVYPVKAVSSKSKSTAVEKSVPDKSIRILKDNKKPKIQNPIGIRLPPSTKVQPSVQKKRSQEIESSNEFNYEDDFEDYESDFQECTDSDTPVVSEQEEDISLNSELAPIELQTEIKKKTINSIDIRRTEEEHMLDSGHYELAEARKRIAIVESINISEKTPPPPLEPHTVIDDSYREEKLLENNAIPVSADEGFEDGRSGDFGKFPQNHLISFEKPAQVNKIKEIPRKALSRGQQLMNMIKLDIVEWSIYESSPIAYEDFIRNFGKLTTQQTLTQTGEDNLEAETQTEEIEYKNKWTQFPVKCRQTVRTVEDLKSFKMEQVGVGGDEDDLSSSDLTTSFDILKLNEFLNKSSKIMLALLEEKELGGSVLQNDVHEFPFSDGSIKLSVNALSFLSGRAITILQYSELSNKILISVHAPIDQKFESEHKQDYITDCCIGCLWNINEPSRPVKLFYSQNEITSCSFHPLNNNIIFAGLQDGSISLWDLREEEMWHQNVTDKINEVDWVIRTSTYTNAGNWETDGHTNKIISIRVLTIMDNSDSENNENKFVPIQICSLDEDGRIILWSIVRNLTAISDDLGLSQWGNIKLIKSQEISLPIKNDKPEAVMREFVDMNIDTGNSNNIYISTNRTNILHTTCLGSKSKPQMYKINEIDSSCGTSCIEVCPFKESYFIIGCNDGAVRLYSLNEETPLLILSDGKSTASIKAVQWSRSKPLIVYILDNHSRIFVWDLSNSDILPMYSISCKNWEKVTNIRLSPCNGSQNMINQYLALGTETGNVEVHKLKKDFYYSSKVDMLREVDTFLHYVSIL